MMTKQKLDPDKYQVSAERYNEFYDLFGSNRTLYLIIQATLRSKRGDLYTINLPDNSIAAVLVTDLFSAFVGPTDFDKEHYIPLFDKTKRHTILLLPDEQWIALAKNYHGFGFVSRKDLRFNFDETNLDVAHLKSISQFYLEKFDDQTYEFRVIQPSDGDHISEYIMEHFETFQTKEELCESNLAHVAIEKETGNVVSVSGAAHSPVDGHYEIQIVTELEHRKKGLSMLITAEHMITAMEAGYTPHWHAASKVSALIAEKLGYGDRIPYTVYFWTTPLIQLLRKSKIPKLIVMFLRKIGKIKD